jgi:3-deoxy-D-manno-octulosonic-acid transferase
MYFLYSILMVTWGILLIPVFCYKAWRYQKYLPGLRQRLGRLPETLRFNGRPTIWFHSCSVGETLSVQPLAHSLQSRFPDARFVFSTITNTGQAIARQRFAKYGEGNTFFFPIDLAWTARRVLNWIRPAMIIIIDTEIWPNVLHQAFLQNVPVVLVNGRISAASFRYYRWARPVLRRVFRNYRMLMMKSEEDAARIMRIGAPREKILVTGNIKYDRDLVEKEVSDEQARILDEALCLNGSDRPLIVAGSTHPGEEQILLEVLRRIRAIPDMKDTRMLLVPRHPERFDAVADLVARSGFPVRRRSRADGDAPDSILLLDTLGELATAYRFATVAFVGGTLNHHGGQSILEPALYGKPIVIGPSMQNFPQIIDEFRARGGVRQIVSTESDRDAQIRELTEAFLELLRNDEARTALGAAAQSVFENNRGAASLTISRIAELYEEKRTR